MSKLGSINTFFGFSEPSTDEDDYDPAPEVSPLHVTSTEDAGDHPAADHPLAPAQDEGGVNRIMTLRPTSFEEADKIASACAAGVPVILNLESVQEREAQRIIDFSSGVVRALDGTLRRAARRVYLLSPKDIAIDAGPDKFANLFG